MPAVLRAGAIPAGGVKPQRALGLSRRARRFGHDRPGRRSTHPAFSGRGHPRRPEPRSATSLGRSRRALRFGQRDSGPRPAWVARGVPSDSGSAIPVRAQPGSLPACPPIRAPRIRAGGGAPPACARSRHVQLSSSGLARGVLPSARSRRGRRHQGPPSATVCPSPRAWAWAWSGSYVRAGQRGPGCRPAWAGVMAGQVLVRRSSSVADGRSVSKRTGRRLFSPL